MRPVIGCALLILLPFLSSAAQGPRGGTVPLGARVKIESRSLGKTIEGGVVSWSNDTLVVRAIAPREMQGQTIYLSTASLNSVRVMESPPLWRFPTATDINFYMAITVPSGGSNPGAEESLPAGVDQFRHILLVATRSEFAGVDPVNGSAIWTRSDLPNLTSLSLDVVGWTGYGVITRGATMEIIDLTTGASRWNTEGLRLTSARGWLPGSIDDSLLLMYGRTAQSPSTLMAVDVGTGNVRWRQDSLFLDPPKVFGTGGVSYLLGHQTPFADSDTTLVLYISKDGPIRLDARTGALLWRASVLSDAKIPDMSDGFAPIRLGPGLLLVPSETRLWAFNIGNGRSVWNPARQFKSPVIWMRTTRSGLLVRGDEWLDLLEPATGASLWRAPVALPKSTRIIVRGDTAYVSADKKVLAIRVPDGSSRTLGTVDFKLREMPGGFGVFDEGIVLNSWHNLVLMDRQGTVRYQRLYPSPGQSLGEGLASGLVGTSVMRPTTRWGGYFAYFFTGQQDEAGRDGFSIVKFDAARGQEQSRVWLDERDPTYVLETSSGSVYYRRNGHEITALKFGDGNTLAQAAMNGHATEVESLLVMGVDVTTPGDEGWTALHYAAWGGHLEVVNLLISHGAEVSRGTLDGWTAWMLATREGHTEVAKVLQEAGAEYTPATAALLLGWHLAIQGRITDAIAAYAEAQALDSLQVIFPTANWTLCWQGSVNGRPADVLAACELAVRQTPPANSHYTSVLFARGFARALTADFLGAATDLKASLAADEDNGTLRRWIDELSAERNPFTPEVIAGLRRH